MYYFTKFNRYIQKLQLNSILYSFFLDGHIASTLTTGLILRNDYRELAVF